MINDKFQATSYRIRYLTLTYIVFINMNHTCNLEYLQSKSYLLSKKKVAYLLSKKKVARLHEI